MRTLARQLIAADSETGGAMTHVDSCLKQCTLCGNALMH